MRLSCDHVEYRRHAHRPDLLGVPRPPTTQGRSFASHLTGATPEPRNSALVSRWCKDGPQFYHHTLYTSRWRLSWFYNQSDGELYDLRSDPHELTNLFHLSSAAPTRNLLLLDLLKTAARVEPPDVPADCPW